MNWQPLNGATELKKGQLLAVLNIEEDSPITDPRVVRVTAHNRDFLHFDFTHFCPLPERPASG